jgi:FlaA1/EpsC-like NDP-sugar epimerase
MNLSLQENVDYKNFFTKIVGRPETELLSDEFLLNKFGETKILIIGAAGTIGSAISSRLTSAGVGNVFFLDRDESALHALSLKLSNVSASISRNYFVGDIRDPIGVRNIIKIIEPTFVIHAAALKHLVILERFPREGFYTNIRGTLNVAQACKQLGIKKFINISTDKAAHPISILGKTKKLTEIICEDIFSGTEINQCSVRFGNVFASRGSVIETFIHQIKNDLPITITDKSVARFFMSRDEAANLVLASATLEPNGTYIQNMGDQVLIEDIVKRISEFFDKKPNIKYVGLQKGEKLTEQLFDGPTMETEYAEISRSVHEILLGLADTVKELNPVDDEEASKIIESLVSKWLK